MAYFFVEMLAFLQRSNDPPVRKAETRVLVTRSQCKIIESRLQKRLGDVNCEFILDTLRYLQSDFKTERSCLLEKSKKKLYAP